MKHSDDVFRLMRLIDAASDPEFFGELTSAQAAVERQAAALGAIAFLLLRQDEEMWDAWIRW